tara:strand:+ start:124 stop:252 length:129 start_codon:yes stop_codon:yes gene_type:complete
MRGLTAKIEKPKKRRKGIHAKSKMSKNKSSKNYVKPYAKQGR